MGGRDANREPGVRPAIMCNVEGQVFAFADRCPILGVGFQKAGLMGGGLPAPPTSGFSTHVEAMASTHGQHF